MVWTPCKITINRIRCGRTDLNHLKFVDSKIYFDNYATLYIRVMFINSTMCLQNLQKYVYLCCDKPFVFILIITGVKLFQRNVHCVFTQTMTVLNSLNLRMSISDAATATFHHDCFDVFLLM